MRNMLNMSNDMLLYANQYAQCATKVCKTVVQGSYSAYFANCNMKNMLNMSYNVLLSSCCMQNNVLLYAKQYAKQ
jgi:hypothetical protein